MSYIKLSHFFFLFSINRLNRQTTMCFIQYFFFISASFILLWDILLFFTLCLHCFLYLAVSSLAFSSSFTLDVNSTFRSFFSGKNHMDFYIKSNKKYILISQLKNSYQLKNPLAEITFQLFLFLIFSQ